MNRNKLIEDNMWLAKYLADKIYWRMREKLNCECVDIIQEGYKGLIKASKTFKEDVGVKFETYATIRIKGEIYNFIRDKNNMVKNKRGDRTILTESTDKIIYHATDDADVKFIDTMHEENSEYENIDIKIIAEKILSDRDKYVFEMYFEKDIKQIEISKILNIAQSGVGKILKRIKIKFIEELEINVCKYENLNKEWEVVEENKLIEMFNDGFDFKEISKAIDRSMEAVRVRYFKIIRENRMEII